MINRFGKTIALAFAAICIVTCASESPGPPMPSYTTEAGKACARTCQDKSSNCKLACGQMMRGATTSRQRGQCLDDCDATLPDCYSKCE